MRILVFIILRTFIIVVIQFTLYACMILETLSTHFVTTLLYYCRIEPLLCPEYANIAPVLVHSYNAVDKIPYNELPLEPILIAREKDRDASEARSRTNSGSNSPVSSVPSTPVKGVHTFLSITNLFGAVQYLFASVYL